MCLSSDVCTLSVAICHYRCDLLTFCAFMFAGLLLRAMGPGSWWPPWSLPWVWSCLTQDNAFLGTSPFRNRTSGYVKSMVVSAQFRTICSSFQDNIPARLAEVFPETQKRKACLFPLGNVVSFPLHKCESLSFLCTRF